MDDFKNSLQQLTAHKIATYIFYQGFEKLTVVKLADAKLDWTAAELAKLLHIDESTAKSVVKITAISATGSLATFLVVPVALPLIGFEGAGVAAGSLAALIQSVVYQGETAGLFSLLQSAGALGISATTQVMLGLLGGGTAGGIAAGVEFSGAEHTNAPSANARVM